MPNFSSDADSSIHDKFCKCELLKNKPCHIQLDNACYKEKDLDELLFSRKWKEFHESELRHKAVPNWQC